MNDENENFYAVRWQWLGYLVERQDITHGDFRVAYFIASKINPNGGTMWWRVDSIANEMGVSIATVTHATRRLNELGFLVVTKGGKGLHRYSMNIPYEPVGPLRVKRKKTGGRKPRVSNTETG